MRTFLAVAAGTAIVCACDRRPIDATAALPAPGSRVPTFSLPATDGDRRFTEQVLHGRPAVIALWSIHCPFQGPAMAAFDSLAQEFRSTGVQFVLLTDDAPGRGLDSALQHAAWRASVDRIGIASGGLARLFDQSATGSHAHPYRAEFVLPSFLLIDRQGTVVRRAFGPAAAVFRQPLDSLVTIAATEPAAT